MLKICNLNKQNNAQCKQTKDFCIRILAFAAYDAFFSEKPFKQIFQAFSILIAIYAVIIIGAMTDRKKNYLNNYIQNKKNNRKKYFKQFEMGM
ncbi:unnamed protein product [Paramecium sonneborni]|uniref:Uncharacterized protein n=1 Tax=Paramecium sonneborni TaxID=65129 RepID=A0A8S1RKG6_9CILI|nr:unnamed protein product [Paramecium sonneborni]